MAVEQQVDKIALDKPQYAPCYSSKGVFYPSRAIRRTATSSNILKGTEYEFEQFSLLLSKGNQKMSVVAHKLLVYCAILFTHNNNISVNIKNYGCLCGYDLEEHDTTEAERKRVTNKIKNLYTEINKAAKTLISLHIRDKKTIDGHTNNIGYINIFEKISSIKNGFFEVRFTRTFETYLRTNKLMLYVPLAFFKIDGRSYIEWQLALKLLEHYGISSNQKYNVQGKLTIRSILENCSLPSYAAITKNHHSWENRIKEPLETALDDLYKLGIIKDWQYIDRYIFPNFTDWEKAIIEYELTSYPSNRI